MGLHVVMPRGQCVGVHVVMPRGVCGGCMLSCMVWYGGMRNIAFRWLAFAHLPPPLGGAIPGSVRSPAFRRSVLRGSLLGRSRRWRPPLLYPLYLCPGGGHGSDFPCGASLDSPWVTVWAPVCTSALGGSKSVSLGYRFGLGFQRAGGTRRDPSVSPA